MSYYNTVNDNTRTNSKYNIWLVNTLGHVLVKQTNDIHTLEGVADLTLESENLDDLIKQVELNWGILCSKGDLKDIYSIKSDNEVIKGKILMLNLTWEQKSLIENRCSGKFVSYRELDDKFGDKIVCDKFKEAFYSLIAKLDNVYGHYNSQVLMHF